MILTGACNGRITIALVTRNNIPEDRWNDFAYLAITTFWVTGEPLETNVR